MKTASKPMFWFSLALVAACFSSSVWAQDNCRFKAADAKALITPDNPFFYNHHWRDEDKTETAQLSPERLVSIAQYGCLRYHTHINYTLLTDKKNLSSPNFFVVEIFSLLNKLYRNSPEYSEYRLEFESEFIKHFPRTDPMGTFNFPLSDFTFLCDISPVDGGANVKLDIVRFLHEHEIVVPGIKEHLDDGYFKAVE